MKHESAAERALNGQIRRLTEAIAKVDGNIRDLATERHTLVTQRKLIEDEVLRLSAQRKTASETRK